MSLMLRQVPGSDFISIEYPLEFMGSVLEIPVEIPQQYYCNTIWLATRYYSRYKSRSSNNTLLRENIGQRIVAAPERTR